MTTLALLDERIERLELRLGLLDRTPLPPTQFSIDPYGNPAHVIGGEVLESAWANAVSDRAHHSFPTAAELTAWPGVEGTFATALDTELTYKRSNGVWVPTIVRGNLIAINPPTLSDEQLAATIPVLPAGRWLVTWRQDVLGAGLQGMQGTGTIIETGVRPAATVHHGFFVTTGGSPASVMMQSVVVQPVAAGDVLNAWISGALSSNLVGSAANPQTDSLTARLV